MKLIVIMLFAACIQVSARGLSQSLTITLKKASLEKVFSEIQKQTGYSFFYEDGLLKNAKPVDIAVVKASITQVLDLCFTNQPFTYKIVNNAISVRRKEQAFQASFLPTPPSGDPVTVSGKVTDEQGNPLVGANVKVKGSNVGTTTDNQGRFTLSNVDENATLEISFVGHEPQLLPVKGRTVFSVALGQKVGTLDETIVIAYGTTTRRFSTGNISSVKASDIEKQPVNNPLLALQGRVPGLFITQNTGVPGGGITVRVQGQNSINNGNDPLYVIDGVPYSSQLQSVGNHDAVLGSSGGTGASGNGNPLSYINPLDIESIDVLKDADATAIYGSRAANGAILITTKKGKAGKTKIDLNFQQGWGKVTRTMDVLDRQQYLDMRYEAYKNDGVALSSLTPGSRTYDLTVWDTTRSTDWQKLLIGGAAQYNNVNASVSGGTAALQYLIGGTYRRETTVFPGNFSNQNTSVHFNISNVSLDQRFHLQLSGSYLIGDNKLPGNDLTTMANQLEPVAPEMFNPDGSLNWALAPSGATTWQTHPLTNVLYRKYSNKTNNLVSNLQIAYNILKGLELKSSFGYTTLQGNDFIALPMIIIAPADKPFSSRQATYGSRIMRSWIIEPQVTYKGNISKGRLEGLVGASIQQNKNNSGSLLGEVYTSDQLLEDIKGAAKITAGTSIILAYKYNAIFGRLNYNWDGKYIINLNARRDGSSRFGANNRFHNFKSIGAAWIFNQESFLQRNFKLLSFGKLRGSYGTTGNDQIPDYQFLNLYSIVNNGVPYQNNTGLFPANISNPYLQWEETKKMQIGIDLGFIRDRILLAATFVRNRSSNQLISYVLPTVTGNNSLVQNFPAIIQNTSWEFTMNTINIIGQNLNWTSNINVTIPRNKLVAFPNLAKSTYTNQLIIGQPLYPNKVYQFAGVDPITGLYQVYDADGKLTTTPNSLTDKTVILTKLPKFYGGFQNNVRYKGFDLDFMFQFVKQKGVNNYFNNGTGGAPGVFVRGSSNQPVTVLERWQNLGDDASVQKFTAILGGTVYNQLAIAQASDGLVTDASFVRLKNLSLSWQIPSTWKSKAHLQTCRLFIQGQNLLTITNYKGADPENQGYASLPPLRVITIGIGIGF